MLRSANSSGKGAFRPKSGAQMKLSHDMPSHSQSLLHAVRKGCLPDVMTAIERGADVNAADTNGRTGLHWAVMKNHLSILSVLMQSDRVDMAAVDKHGRTALHAACGAKLAHDGPDDCGAVALLLQSPKVNINCKDNRGETPLMWAAFYGRKEVVSFLLTNGAIDVTAANVDGKTAEELAMENKHFDVALLVRLASKAGSRDKRKSDAKPTPSPVGEDADPAAVPSMDSDEEYFVTARLSSQRSPSVLTCGAGRASTVSPRSVHLTRSASPPTRYTSPSPQFNHTTPLSPRVPMLKASSPPSLQSPGPKLSAETQVSPIPHFIESRSTQTSRMSVPIGETQPMASEPAPVVAAVSPVKRKDLGPRGGVVASDLSSPTLPILSSATSSPGSSLLTSSPQKPLQSRFAAPKPPTSSFFSTPTYQRQSVSPPRQLPVTSLSTVAAPLLSPSTSDKPQAIHMRNSVQLSVTSPPPQTRQFNETSTPQLRAITPPPVPKVKTPVIHPVRPPHNPQLDQFLIAVTQNGTVEDFRALIADGADVNCKDSAGWRPIHIAAWRRRLSMLRAILAVPGVISDAPGPAHTRPIHVACMRHPKAAPDLVDNFDAVKLLVEICDADVNCTNDNGDTPLTLAIACKLDMITRYLISLPQIGLGEPRPGMPTPVALAMKHNRLDVASLIISTQELRLQQQAAKPQIEGKPAIVTDSNPPSPKAPLPLSPEGRGQPPTVPPKRGPVVSPRRDQCVIVTRESAVALHESQRQLLPLSPQRQPLPARSSVIDYIRAGDVTAMDALLASGLDTSVKDSKGWTVLHVAAWHRKHDVIRKLLTARPDLNVDVRTDSGLTPLHLACTRNPDFPLLSDDITATETAQLLIDRGASVNAKSRDGQTAITLAIASVLKGCVQVLANVRGLDWDVTDEFGKSPVAIAEGTGNSAIIAAVKEVAPPSSSDAVSALTVTAPKPPSRPGSVASHRSDKSGVSELSRKSKTTDVSRAKGSRAQKPPKNRKKQRQPSVVTTEVSSSDEQSSEDEKGSDGDSKYTYVTATATAISSSDSGVKTAKTTTTVTTSRSDSDSSSSSSEGESDSSEPTKAKPSLDDEALLEMVFNGVTANKDNTIRLAVMSGADVNGVNKDGWTPLQIAAFLRHTDAMKQLLETPGIQVNMPGQYGMRAVHFAASVMGNKPLALVDKPECMQMLFEEGGADLNATTDTGETPLTLAASQGLKHIAEYLVSLPGVDLNKTGSDGKLPEIIALEATHMETARIIRTERIARGGFNPNKSSKDNCSVQ